jgi:ABC-2 type transport system ATP-binding protein
MPQIAVRGLTKSYRVAERAPGLWGAAKGLVHRTHRIVPALTDVDFEIERGELVAYIGPNGAGKSTTVKILSGVLVPDRGVCEVEGRVPWKERVAHVAGIGVVFGQRTQLWWDLPVVESFELLRSIYRVDTARHQRVRQELVELLALGPLLHTPVRQLSLGQRMRCDLVAALLHEPRVLFLDEPTIGLDAVSKLAVRRFIRRLNVERGVTVLLTTHDMDDVEAVCDRVMVIGGGRVLSDGTMDDLRRRVSPERRLIVDLARPDDEISDGEARVIERNGQRVTMAFDPGRTPAATLIARITGRHEVRDLFVEHPPIEEVIAELYARHEGTALAGGDAPVPGRR